LSVGDWAEIRRLHRSEGWPIRMIARVLGISRNTGGGLGYAAAVRLAHGDPGS